MGTDRRKAFDVEKDCYHFPEIKLIAFKCRICREKCEIGEEIVKTIDRFEIDEFHRKAETE